MNIQLPQDLYMAEQSEEKTEEERGLVAGYKKGYIDGYKYGIEKAKKEGLKPAEAKQVIQQQEKSSGLNKSILLGGLFATIIGGFLILRRRRKGLSDFDMSREDIISNYVSRIKAYQRQLDYYNSKGISKQDIIYTKLLNDINKLKSRLRLMNIEPSRLGIR